MDTSFAPEYLFIPFLPISYSSVQLMLQKSFDSRTEEKWQKRWQEEGTYSFDPSSDKPLYSMDTPPPFTSGELHMGHVLSYAYFDFVARYKRMNGFSVFYPQGWDTQGFPTEVKVEKKYGKLPPVEFRQKTHPDSRPRASLIERSIPLSRSDDMVLLH